MTQCGVGTRTYQWDAEGRLKSVDNGSTDSFTYNALGQQVQKHVAVPPSSDLYYYYDAFGNLAMTQSASTRYEYTSPSIGGRNFANHDWHGSAWETQ